MEVNETNEAEESQHPSLKAVFVVILLSMILAGTLTLISSGSPARFQLIIGELFLILPAIFYLIAKKYNLAEVFRIKKIDRTTLLISFVLGISISILSDEMDRIVSTFIKLPPELEEILVEMFKVESLMDWMTILLAAVVFAGIFEEMLFRGLLQKALERKYNFQYAIFVSAFIFAVVHLTPFLLQVLVLGVVLGFLAWRSQSIIPGVILHCINNTLSIIFINVDENQLSWYNWNEHVNPTIVAIAACITFYAFKSFLRATDKSSETRLT